MPSPRRPPPGARSRGSTRGSAPARRRGRQAGRRNQRSDLAGRLAAAVPAIVFAIVIVSAGGVWWALGLILLGLVCLHELYDLLGDTAPIRLAGFVGLVGLVLAANFGNQYDVLLVAMALLPILFALTVIAPRADTVSMSTTLLGVWWVGFAMAHAVLLRGLPHGAGVVVDVLVGTFLGDTCAYIGGRTFGRRPLAPSLSPSKTVEGLLCGIAGAIFGVWLASTYQDWLPAGRAVLLGLGVALAAPVGDLFESFIKRNAGAKDTGRLFGAHGGALDRLDAVLFSIVVGYYIWHAMLR
jgi:phosphatidate cytidylyltransferase